MQRLFAIAWLTWKAAFRFRLFWVLAFLLLSSVVVLPLVLKDDGTARGFTQILLTYTLSVITALLGLATLWLSCGTLARDIEERQIQLIDVKPIARWQVWLGKWLGIMALNSALLIITGSAVYFLLQWRAGKLPEAQQRILRSEILVARGSLREAPPDLQTATESVLRERLKDVPKNSVNVLFVRKQVEEQVKAAYQLVMPNHLRRWTIDLGLRKNFLRDEPLFIRMKFHAASTNELGTYQTVIEVGPPDSPRRALREVKLAANTFHEIPIPPNLFDALGKLTIDIQNRDRVALLFPLDEGLEVLYREGSFALNFARALSIILCWLALLASLGLFAASFLSFPVAAFFSATLLIAGFSTGTLSSAVESGTIGTVNEETGETSRTVLDVVVIPMFKGLLKIFNLVQGFSPIDALSTGRSIGWDQIGLAVGEIVLLLAGVIAMAGIVIFTRRELASAQTTT